MILGFSTVDRLSGDGMTDTIFREKPPFTEDRFQKIKRDLEKRCSMLQNYLKNMCYDEKIDRELSQLQT